MGSGDTTALSFRGGLTRLVNQSRAGNIPLTLDLSAWYVAATAFAVVILPAASIYWFF